jgi:D-inositol-3-phosphate glycosyltransferase
MMFSISDQSAVRRIAVLSYHSNPLVEPGTGDAGGMTVYVRALANELARRGLRTDIFTRATGDARPIVEISPGVRVVSIEAGPLGPVEKEHQPEHIPAFVDGVRAFSVAQRINYDLVHSHYWQSGLAAKDLSVAWGVPFVHSHHSLGRVKNHFLAPGDAPEPKRRLDGEAEVISWADVLIASTDEEWSYLSCLYSAPHDRLKTLLPGVDHGLFEPGDRTAARLRLGLGDGPVLLYVGRIQRLKGIDLAIRAVEQLASALDAPPVFIVVGGTSGRGGEAELERLKALAESLGIEDLMRFEGPQPHARLPDYYRAADALLLCSHSESFGLAALEAHACGTPVIATDVGGLSHIVADGESGFLVDSRDAAEFAGRLKMLLSDDAMQRRFQAEAEKRAVNFSWEATADSFLELYECVVREESMEVCTC